MLLPSRLTAVLAVSDINHDGSNSGCSLKPQPVDFLNDEGNSGG